MRGFEVARACAELIDTRQRRHALPANEDCARRICGALIGRLDQPISGDQIAGSVMHLNMLPGISMGR